MAKVKVKKVARKTSFSRKQAQAVVKDVMTRIFNSQPSNSNAKSGSKVLNKQSIKSVTRAA